MRKIVFKAFISMIAIGTSFAQVLTPYVENELEPILVSGKYFPYRFAIRGNFLYDALLLPSLGVEWRVSPSVGMKMDFSYSFWGNETGMVQKMWLLNPEVRWYMGKVKRFYVGISSNFGKANVYDELIDRILNYFYDDYEGSQGIFRNIGFTVGFQFYISRKLSLDFNVGLGYTFFKYDTFVIKDGDRVYTGRENRTDDLWGPTQAGMSLIWTLGGK